jgi:PhnB protein
MFVTPNYHFNGNCAEALQLYKKAFSGIITVLLSNCDANPSDMPTEHMTDREKSLVYHAEMTIGQQRFMFSDVLDAIPQGQNISTLITFDSVEKVKAAYQVLSEGCTVIHPMTTTTYSDCFVSFVDKFGMRWELMTENDT